MRRTHVSIEDRLVNALAYILVTAFAALTLYPFWNVVVVSISEYSAYARNPMMLWPSNINLIAYRVVFSHSLLKSSYVNTVFVTVTGTLTGLVLTTLMAYSLSKKELKGKGFFMTFIIFTMLFNGGLIPNFYLIRSLGLIDKLWALILPASLSAFNVILMKNFFEHLPGSLEESAKIDGASYPQILTRIILPLSKPILSTIGLFLAVMYWNSFFSAVVYIRSKSKWPLQLLLREVIASTQALFESTQGNLAEMGLSNLYPVTLQYATLIIAVLPIMVVYPFLQKHFVKGVMIGAVKG